MIREAVILDFFFFVKSLHKMVPPRPPFMKSLFIYFSVHFWAKKKMILKVVWRVLMGVLRVFEGCCRVFEVCLEGVWKNKIEVWNQSDPSPPGYEIISQKKISQMMPSQYQLQPKHKIKKRMHCFFSTTWRLSCSPMQTCGYYAQRWVEQCWYLGRPLFGKQVFSYGKCEGRSCHVQTYLYGLLCIFGAPKICSLA